MGNLDPRKVANQLLDLADEFGIEITHVKLQKLLYFADDAYCVRKGIPLVAGEFEAWDHGPVLRTVYLAFKSAGSDPIKFRASKKDLRTGRDVVLESLDNEKICAELSRLVNTYGRLSTWRLVDLSHKEGGPWDVARSRMEAGRSFGTFVERRGLHSVPHVVKSSSGNRRFSPSENEVPIDDFLKWASEKDY